jgi:hypothetical protein
MAFSVRWRWAYAGVGFHVPLESGMRSASMSRSPKCHTIATMHECFAADRMCAKGGGGDTGSSSVVVIYCHLSKLSVGQTPRLYNLPSKSYSSNINVPYTGGNDLVKESGKPFNGMPIKF